MTARALVVTFFALGAISLSGCGPLLFVEAETEEICKTLPDVPMPGIPGNQAMSLDTGTDYDLGAEMAGLPLDELDGELRLLSLTFTPVRGVPDLSFVETARISVVGSSGTEEPVVDYARKGTASAVQLQLAASTPPDLFSYLISGKVKLAAKLSGVFPQSAWGMDARACFHVRTRVNYGSALQALQAQGQK